MKRLSHEEKLELEALLKKSRDIDERTRLCVILGYDDEISKVSLARTLRIHPQTVDKYLKEYDRNKKTRGGPRGGSDPKLSEEESKELIDHLQKTTYLKVRAICCYVKKRYGIEYSRTGMRDWLQRQGFTYKKPEKVPGKLDPEKQKAFISYYKSLKDNISPEDAILFVDATHPEYQSQNVCGWIKRGEKKTLQTTGKQQRLHLVGALSLNGLKVITQEYPTIDATAMKDFFLTLQKQYPKDSMIHVILDNGKAGKNKEVWKALENTNIRLHYLPPYSPNLNPIERLWKLMRENVHYNRFYETTADFFEAVRLFFKENVPRMRETITKRLTDNFQVIELNPIKLVV
jgi:transposase